MTMRFKILLGFLAAVLIVLLILTISSSDETEGTKKEKSMFSGDFFSKRTAPTPQDPFFPNAPNPYGEDPALLDEVERLWPHALEAPMSEEEREKNREEWIKFAKKYPDNIYIPDEFRPPLTDEQKKQARQTLDDVTAAEAHFATLQNSMRSAEPGTQPSAASEPQITPKEQRTYMEYKIRALESKIQIVQHFLSERTPDDTTVNTAQQDITEWKRQIAEIKQMMPQIPGS